MSQKHNNSSSTATTETACKTANKNITLGVDVGSTTVKVVAVNDSSEIIWSCYQRHETRQAEKVLELLGKVTSELALDISQCKIFYLSRKVICRRCAIFTV